KTPWFPGWRRAIAPTPEWSGIPLPAAARQAGAGMQWHRAAPGQRSRAGWRPGGPRTTRKWIRGLSSRGLQIACRGLRRSITHHFNTRTGLEPGLAVTDQHISSARTGDQRQIAVLIQHLHRHHFDLVAIDPISEMLLHAALNHLRRDFQRIALD